MKKPRQCELAGLFIQPGASAVRLVLLGGGLGSGLGFTLATTHFTWVVGRAAVRQEAGRGFLGSRGFDRRRLDRYRRLLGHFWLYFDNRSGRFDDRDFGDWRCDNLGFHDLGAYNLSAYDLGFDNLGFGDLGFDSLGLDDFGFHDLRLDSFRLDDLRLDNHWLGGRDWFGRSLERRRLYDRLRYHFDYRLGAWLDHGKRLAGRLLGHWSGGDFIGRGHGLGCNGLEARFGALGFRGGCRGRFCLGSRLGGTLGLLVSLGFGAGADVAGGYGSGHRQACGQVGTQVVGLRLLGLALGLAFGFAAFDQVTVGIALTLAAVAAATLATGATARTLAVCAFLLIVLQQLFVRQLLFASLFRLHGGLRLLLFTRWTRLALLARGTFFTRCTLFARRTFLARGTFFTWRAFFSRSTLFTWRAFFTRRTFVACCTLFTWRAFFAHGRRGVQWLAQFAYALFTVAATLVTRLAWLAFLARCALFARRTFFTWCALFAGYAFFTWGALFAWLAFFTRGALGTLFARLAALVVATATAVAALLATVAALFVALRALGGRLLGDGRGSGWRFLGGEQADQRLHQALEQAWLRHCRSRGWRGSGRLWFRGDRHRGVGAGRGGLDRGFLAYQGAGGGGLRDLFDLGGGDLVARLGVQRLGVVVAQALDFEVRSLEVVVRQDDDPRAGAQLDLGDGVALLVEQEGSDRDRHQGANLGGAVLQGFFLDQAQDGQ